MVGLAVLAVTAQTPSPLSPTGNAACLECHGAPTGSVVVEPYVQSPHGVLSCERCHGEAAGTAHAESPNLALMAVEGRERLAAYAARCTKCHAAVIPSYEKSFHGIAVRNGDLRAATCVDCHGVHNVFGATDTQSLVHPDNLAGTCATTDCHPGAPPGFAGGREHVDPAQPGTGTDAWLHWTWKFFIGLILFDVMKDGPIVLFELLRRIRG